MKLNIYAEARKAAQGLQEDRCKKLVNSPNRLSDDEVLKLDIGGPWFVQLIERAAKR